LIKTKISHSSNKSKDCGSCPFTSYFRLILVMYRVALLGLNSQEIFPRVYLSYGIKEDIKLWIAINSISFLSELRMS